MASLQPFDLQTPYRLNERSRSTLKVFWKWKGCAGILIFTVCRYPVINGHFWNKVYIQKIMKINLCWSSKSFGKANHHINEVIWKYIFLKIIIFLKENIAGFIVILSLLSLKLSTESFISVEIGRFFHIFHLTYETYFEILHHSLNENAKITNIFATFKKISGSTELFAHFNSHIQDDNFASRDILKKKWYI